MRIVYLCVAFSMFIVTLYVDKPFRKHRNLLKIAIDPFTILLFFLCMLWPLFWVWFFIALFIGAL